MRGRPSGPRCGYLVRQGAVSARLSTWATQTFRVHAVKRVDMLGVPGSAAPACRQRTDGGGCQHAGSGRSYLRAAARCTVAPRWRLDGGDRVTYCSGPATRTYQYGIRSIYVYMIFNM